MSYLEKKMERVRARLAAEPLDDEANRTRTATLPPVRSLAEAIRSAEITPALIAEVKRASPSAGAIAERDTTEQARAYEAAGAVAVSILTDLEDFGGTNRDLVAARTAVDVPLLRKDFLVHPSQLVESRALGADAVLLIASALGSGSLGAMLRGAQDLGLEALVETHDAVDLQTALGSGAEIIGVNARDLRTLEVDLEAALERLREVPADRIAVLESGVATRADAQAAVAAGASAILVGESLMRADDLGAKIRELMGR
jgi:indole-3-glycerol phosphate synthase